MQADAPSERTNSWRAALATAVTTAPRATATCTVAWPTPPAAPLTRTRLPAATRPSVQRVTAVAPAQASAAASVSASESGRGKTYPAGTGQYSANVPAVRRNGSRKPNTRWPMAKPLTPSPRPATSPAKSDPIVRGRPPRTSGRKLPVAIFQSTGLTLAARTRTSTSPRAGTGIWTSSSFSVSGSPKEWYRAASMGSPAGVPPGAAASH